MARIFRQAWSQKRDDGSKRHGRTRKWYVTYRDADGIMRTVPGYTDRGATVQLAARLERDAARRTEGIIDRFTDHAKRPLAEHLADWRAALVAKGRTERHAELSHNRVRRVLDGCGFTACGELSASGVQAHLADLRGGGLSAESVNHYVRALKGFARWMVRDGRAADDPLASLTLLNSRTDRRHDRRALEPDELRRLLDAARGGPVRYGIAGPDRATLYLAAVGTGFRAGELRSLTPASFQLDSDPPTVTVGAAYSKRRRNDVQPIRAELAEALAAHLAARGPDGPAFPMPSACNVVRMLRADLADAGIVYRDSAGRVADFHALRHTYVSNLARAGVHPKLAQQLARHSTIALTMDRYTHTMAGELADAVNAVPYVPDSNESAAAVARATGTYGDDAGEALTAPLTAQACGRGRKPSAGVGDTTLAPAGSGARYSLRERELDGARRDDSLSVGMGRGGLEPPTHGFSVRCSTN